MPIYTPERFSWPAGFINLKLPHKTEFCIIQNHKHGVNFMQHPCQTVGVAASLQWVNDSQRLFQNAIVVIGRKIKNNIFFFLFSQPSFIFTVSNKVLFSSVFLHLHLRDSWRSLILCWSLWVGFFFFLAAHSSLCSYQSPSLASLCQASVNQAEDLLFQWCVNKGDSVDALLLLGYIPSTERMFCHHWHISTHGLVYRQQTFSLCFAYEWLSWNALLLNGFTWFTLRATVFFLNLL